MNVLRYLYTVLLIIAIPFIFLRLLWRGIKAPDYRKRIVERFACYSQSYAQSGIWLHAVSVGELMAARPLILKIKEHYPDLPLTITTITPTGSAQVKKIYANSVQHVYLPYDYPSAIKRFLRTFKPQLAIIMETEIWPNLFYYLKESKIPFVIANARLSEQSFHYYEKFKFFFQPVLQQVTTIAAQSALDAEHFKKLGALPSQVMVMGNIKYDVAVPLALIEKAKKTRAQMLFDNIWIASSTHAAEEDLIINTVKAVKEKCPNTLCIIAPRHPERFNPIAEKCIAQGLTAVRHSTGERIANQEVLIADVLGELFYFYALADVALVCGSFAPIGGHNILEPASLGLPTLVGPQTFNFKAITADFLKADALLQVNEETLLPRLIALINDKTAAKALGQRGHALVLANQGAIDKLWQVLMNSVTLNK